MEHSIRLRAAWDGGVDGQAGRVDLPIVWPPEVAGRRVVLSRSFRSPALADGESIRLILEDVPGLSALSIDGVVVPISGSPDARIEVELDPAPRRRTVRVEAIPGVGGPWGSIHLSIRSAGPMAAGGPRPL